MYDPLPFYFYKNKTEIPVLFKVAHKIYFFRECFNMYGSFHNRR